MGSPMTHDDLIAILDDLDTGFNNGFGTVSVLIGVANALRSVIELHAYDAEWDLCMVCDTPGVYPCDTIKGVMEVINNGK